MTRIATFLAVVALSATAWAQHATVFVKTNPDGTKSYSGVLSVDGKASPITSMTLIELLPPSPPQPVTLATSAMVLLETQEQGHELATLRVKLATDPWLQGKIMMLDRDAKDENNQPVKRVQAARQFVGNKPLPQLVGFGRDGNPVVAEALPATAPLVVDQMKKWGIK